MANLLEQAINCRRRRPCQRSSRTGRTSRRTTSTSICFPKDRGPMISTTRPRRFIMEVSCPYGSTARRDMERRRRLHDLLAFPARELFPHRPDHLPLLLDYLVSVMSSPSFGSFAEPQQGQLSGAAMTMRSRGR